MPTKPRSAARPVPTFDHLMALPPLELRDWLPTDYDAAQAVFDAQRTLELAQRINDPAQVANAVAAVRSAEDTLHSPEHSVQVRFRNPGKKTWARLKAMYPPTTEQQADKDLKGVDYDPDAIAVPLIAAAMVEPRLTVEQVQELHDSDTWGEADLAHLLSLALIVTTRRRNGGTYRFS